MKNFRATIIVLFAMICLSLTGCAYQQAVHQCMERHPGCRWNCELQYGWSTPDVQRKAAIERCYW